MLYILPPPSAPNPPSPWDSIVCQNQTNHSNRKNSDVTHINGVHHQINNNTNKINYVRPSPRRSRYRALSKFRNCFESAGPDEDDAAKNKSLSECYFAGKSAALVLGQSEKLLRSTMADGQRLSIGSNSTVTNTNITCQMSGSDIQQHLQSMFYLLHPEETLKMAVKLESVRPGRTRYLVVVSRPCTNTLQTSSSTGDIPIKINDEQQNAQQTITPNLRKTNSLKKIISNSSKHLKQQKYPCSTNKSISSENQQQNLTVSSLTSTTISAPTLSQNINDNNKTINNSNTNNECDKNLSSANNIMYPFTDYLNSDDFCKNSICGNGSEREESCLLGIDCNEKTSVGLVLRILADTTIRLDGDGGFSVSVCGRTHIFKPVSVQAMWSALQTLHKVSSKAREHNYYPGGPSHDWVSYYEDHIESDRSCLNEWNAMDSLESRRPPSPDIVRNRPTEREETEQVIRTTLKEIMMVVDLDEVTSKYIRSRLEEHLDMDLAEFKSFIDQEMLTILGQMDAPTEIFDHVYLGSEWNASNLEELQRNGVKHILNVTREIDNFFPGMFDYFNVRVYDDEKTDLLKHWDKTFKYITCAKMEGSKVLVHCKMGVSRSASVVIAYAMKAYNWDFDKAIKHVKEKRNCIKPNKSFLSQLETYQGMLDAMKNKEKLQRSKSETNLKLNSTKDGRLLPGSEPTPLIQALNVGKAKLLLNVSGKELRKNSERPKSWSPDSNVLDDPIVIELPIKPQSQSLENLGITTTPLTVTTNNIIVTIITTPIESCQENNNNNSHDNNNDNQSSNTNKSSNNKLNESKETKHIRLPCFNGQNYSVSQNQAVHLQQDEMSNNSSGVIPPIELIINELEESNQKLFDENLENYLNLDAKKTTTDIDDSNASNKEIWDPGEENIIIISDDLNVNTNDINNSQHLNNICSDNNNLTICDSPVWTSSAQIVHQTPIVNLNISETKELLNNSCNNDNNSNKKDDLFSSQLDRVFDREEQQRNDDSQNNQQIIEINKINTDQTIPNHHVSRQSSWSSVDSAVVLGYYSGEHRDTPSRHSSWGSGDNRQIPSRNSSWGSYDMRNTKNLSLKDKLKFNRDEILMMSQSGIFPYDKDEIPWHPGTVKRTKQKIEELAVAKRLCSDNYDTNDENKPDNDSKIANNLVTKPTNNRRSNSEEVLGGRSLSSAYYSRLSASAPETSSINFLEGSTTIPLSRRYQYKTRFSIDESSNKKDCDESSSDDCQTLSGIVRNLKMNFEAKSNNKIGKNNSNTSSKGQSLPSSPVAIHSDTNQVNKTSIEQDVINVKGLVDKYEVTKMRGNTTAPLRQQRPRSVIFEPKQFQHNSSSSSSTNSSNKPLLLTHSKIINNTNKPTILDESTRRPPVPPTVIKTNALNNNSNLINNSNSNCSNNKKTTQQHGKTHPLARLGLSKQRVNTAAYNTM